MSARKIVYWVTTFLLALFLIGTGVGDILMIEQVRQSTARLGYPEYLPPFLGVLKIVGAIVIAIPALRSVHQGAYAGIFFYGLGAAYSHIGFGDPIFAAIPGFLIVAFSAISYLSAPVRQTVAQR